MSRPVARTPRVQRGLVINRLSGPNLKGGVPPLQFPKPHGGHDELGVYRAGRLSAADSPMIFAIRFHGPPIKQTPFQSRKELSAGALEHKMLNFSPPPSSLPIIV